MTPVLPDMDQLTQIMKVTGVPGPEFIQKLDSLEVGQIAVFGGQFDWDDFFKSLIPVADILPVFTNFKAVQFYLEHSTLNPSLKPMKQPSEFAVYITSNNNNTLQI